MSYQLNHGATPVEGDETMTTRTKALQIPTLVAALLLSIAAVSFAQKRADDIRHIDAALEALNKATSELKAAGSGYGGHRVKAQDLVKEAEAELRKARKYAQEHPNK